MKKQPAKPLTLWGHIYFVLKMCSILALAATSAEVSTLCLSPVYGSLLSTAGSKTLSGWAIILLVWLPSVVISKQIVGSVSGFYPVLGYLLAAVQPQLFRFSGRLGPLRGPMWTFLFTSFPLSYVSLLHVVDAAKVLFLGGTDGGGTTTNELANSRSLPGLKAAWLLILTCTSYVCLNMFGKMSSALVSYSITTWSIPTFSRFGLQAVLATIYALLERSRLILVAILPILYFALFNPHLPLQYNTAVLNATMQREGYSLVVRQESLSGYISVLDNVKDGFRVMRCDHSLLGGEWINKPEGHPSKLNEPIYAVFVTLEAVRLVETDSESPSAVSNVEKHALVIGLGVGTSPSALIAHGIKTTTVEIDPVVHDFATRYFNLPSNHTSIIGDAIAAVGDLQKERRTYDYIIHDVFTGGVEPIELFTEEFLMDLRNLLSPNGVIAINYAGDLLLPSAVSVIRTAQSVFPTCRLFRESPAASPLGAEDFTNVVMFCRKLAGPFTFRYPVEADFLGSPARRQHLMPRNEIEASYLEHNAMFASFVKGHPMREKEEMIIRRDQISRLQTSQMRSAVGHWHVMRSVLPDVVWENW